MVTKHLCPTCSGASGPYAKGVCLKCYYKRPEVAERRRAQARLYAATPKGRANRARYMQTEAGKASAYRKQRKYQLKQRYGLTPVEAAKLFASNKGLCHICDFRTAEAIDHDHKTGEVRGVLCGTCNLSLGGFGDDAKLLSKAIEYLSKKGKPL